MTVKECTIFFDTDSHQLRRKPHKLSPIANLVCDGKNVGTIEIGYWGFNMYNTVKRVPVHTSYVGDLYKLSHQLKAGTMKHILYNTVISVLYGYMIEENENDDTIYMIKTPYSHYPMDDAIHNPTGLESFIDACYVYLNSTYEDDKKDNEYYTQMNLDDIDEDIKRDLELAEEYEEEDPYNEFEEEGNPAFCMADDPEKGLNFRYD